MPVANAEPTENCSVSAIADTSRTVSESTSTYLEHNADANDELTNIMNSTQSDVTQAFRVYFAENPQVEMELRAINQPAIDLASQCGVEVAPTPITEALTDL